MVKVCCTSSIDLQARLSTVDSDTFDGSLSSDDCDDDWPRRRAGAVSPLVIYMN